MVSSSHGSTSDEKEGGLGLDSKECWRTFVTRKVESELEVNACWFFTGVALNESPCSVSASATLRVRSASDMDSLYDSLYDSLVTAYLT